MQVNTVLNFTEDNTPPISCPINGGFQLTVSGMSGTDSLIIQKSSDNGATWLTHTTISADGTATAIADVSTAMGIRAIADVINAGHSWDVSVKNVVDASGVKPMVPFYVDVIYDFAVQGGAVTDFTLTPSTPVPTGTFCIGLFIQVLTPLAGAGTLGLGLLGNLNCLNNNIPASGILSDIFAAGTREIALDAAIVASITTAVLTAGKVQITLICFTPQV